MLSVQTRIKIQATVSPNYLLGEAHFVRKRLNKNLFKAHLLTVCAYSKTEREPQGGEEASVELDG